MKILGMDRYIHIILVYRIEEEHDVRIEIYLSPGSSLSILLSKPDDSLMISFGLDFESHSFHIDAWLKLLD